MAQTKLGILIETLYKGRGAEQAKKDMQGLDKESSKAEKSGLSLGSALTKIGVAAGIAGTALYTAKKAFDFTREGAQILQLEDSFELMNKQVFNTPTLLNDMRDAARGTIPDTKLMSGLLTLTAGTTREVSQAMAAAAPKLLEIAKASNKLNPALGDTSFLYESLATGIKRSSPLILDNLGLTIKVGEANEKWAAKAGKTVEAMSAQEKQLALLEAALESGDKLIEQVGGNVESAADTWDRFTATLKNATDEAKKHVAQGLMPFIDEIDRQNEAMEKIEPALKMGILTGREWDIVIRSLMKDGYTLTEAYELMAEELGELLEVHRQTHDADKGMKQLKLSTREVTEETRTLTEETRKYIDQLIKESNKLNEMPYTWQEVERGIRMVNIERGKMTDEEVRKFREEVERLKAAILGLEPPNSEELGRAFYEIWEQANKAAGGVADLKHWMDELDGTKAEATVTTNYDEIGTRGNIPGEPAYGQLPPLPAPPPAGPGPVDTPYTPMQSGGQVRRGMPYLVGEAGPELFVPGSYGRIVPNNKMGQGIVNLTLQFYATVTPQMASTAARQTKRVVNDLLLGAGARI